MTLSESAFSFADSMAECTKFWLRNVPEQKYRVC